MIPFFLSIVTLIFWWGSTTCAQEKVCERIASAVEGERAQNSANPLLNSRIPTQRRQRVALDVLSRSPHVSDSLRRIAGEKRRFFNSVSGQDPLVRELSALPAPEQVKYALELVLTTFLSSTHDQPFRRAAIEALGSHPLADARTMEVLLPIARGANLASNAEARLANEAITQIMSNPINANREIFVSPESRASLGEAGRELEQLLNSRIVSIRTPQPGGSGVNASYIITFANGMRGFFKPMAGKEQYHNPERPPGNILFAREVNAYFLVRDFLTPNQPGAPSIVVPPTIEVALRHGDKSYGVGSLQLFMEGYVTVSERYMPKGTAKAEEDGTPITDPRGREIINPNHYQHIWRAQQRDPRWGLEASGGQGLEAWIRTVDYIMGNYDRFPNSIYNQGNPRNIMVPQQDSGGRLGVLLIDNGKGRSPGTGFGIQNCPLAKDIPVMLRRHLMSFDQTAEATLRQRFRGQLPEEGINDIIARIREVQNRIQDARNRREITDPA